MFKKLAVLFILVGMLIPTAVFAKGSENVNLTSAQLKEIADTIDFDDEELYGSDSMSRTARPFSVEFFKVYHREEDKLSMSDAAFIKNECEIYDLGDSYKFVLETQPVSKKILWGTYWADPTEIHFFNKAGEKIKATPSDYEKAVNSDKLVPTTFTITMPKSDIYKGDLGGYNGHYKIWFETNLKDSGAMGYIGDKMMNRNARFAFNSN